MFNLKEFLAVKVVEIAKENIGKVVDSRTAVRKPSGEAKQERRSGSEAPASKRPWLMLRGASRSVVAGVIAIAAFFLADKVPIVASPELQGYVVNSLVGVIEMRLCWGAASDWVRLAPDRGLPARGESDNGR